MPEAFNIDLDSLTEEEYYNYLVRYFTYCFENDEYSPEHIKAMKQALDTYKGD